MVDDSAPQRLAELLVEARRAGEPIAAVPPELIPPGEAAANHVDDLVAAMVEQPVGGWKIGCTSEHAQQLLGATGPIAGRVYDIRSDGARLESSAFIGEPLLEGELAFTFGERVDPSERPLERGAIIGAIETVHPAIEIVGGRYVEFIGMPLDLLIADAAANTLLVLGPGVTDFDSADLPDAAATMTVDGVVTGQGHGRDVLGDPIEALRWLVDHLSRRGIGLAAGAVVTTGTATQVSPLNPGSTATATFDGIGSVTLHRVPD